MSRKAANAIDSTGSHASRGWIFGLRKAAFYAFMALPKVNKLGVLAFLAGVAALVLTLTRTTVYGYLFNFIWVLAFHMGTTDLPSRIVTWSTFVFFEELGRYAYINVATRKSLAALIFFAVTIFSEYIGYQARSGASGTHLLMLRAPSFAVHAIACSAFAWATSRPKWRVPIFIAVWLAHAAFDTWASYITV